MSRNTLTLMVHPIDAPAYSRRFAAADTQVVKLGSLPRSDIPWASLDGAVNTQGWNLAPGVQGYAVMAGIAVDRAEGSAVTDVDGNTLLSNSVVLWTNEQNKGNNHSRFTMPYVLAGGAGGYFNTGRYIKYFDDSDEDEENAGEPPTDIGHNRLLVSLCNAMGIETEEFGDPRFGTGPLDGLT